MEILLLQRREKIARVTTFGHLETLTFLSQLTHTHLKYLWVWQSMHKGIKIMQLFIL